jgi:tetratricopeptide (TPR) repeat protein
MATDKTLKTNRKPAAIGLTLALLVCLAIVFYLRTGTAPPVPEHLSALDPEVAKLLEKRINAVNRNTFSTSRREQLGRAYEANELYSLAAATYEQILTEDPNNGRVWFRYSVCLERLDLDAAIEAMEKAIVLEPNYAPAYWRKAIWLCDVGRFDEAQSRVEQALTIDPDDEEAQLVSAKILVARQQNELAIAYIKRNGLLRSSYREFALWLLGSAHRQMGQLDEAAQWLEQIDNPRPAWRDAWTNELQRDKVGLPRLRVAAATLFKQGRYKAAIEVLNEIIRRGDREFRSWNILGAAYLELGQLEEGIAAFQQAAELDPRHFGSNLNCALAMLSGVGDLDIDLDEALVHANAAVDIRPRSAQARSVRAYLQVARGELELALADFVKAGQLDPGNAQYEASTGLVEIRLERWESAKSRFAKLATSHRKALQVKLGLVAIAAHEGQLEQANRQIRTIRRLELKDPLSASIMQLVTSTLKQQAVPRTNAP